MCKEYIRTKMSRTKGKNKKCLCNSRDMASLYQTEYGKRSNLSRSKGKL